MFSLKGINMSAQGIALRHQDRFRTDVDQDYIRIFIFRTSRTSRLSDFSPNKFTFKKLSVIKSI